MCSSDLRRSRRLVYGGFYGSISQRADSGGSTLPGCRSGCIRMPTTRSNAQTRRLFRRTVQRQRIRSFPNFKGEDRKTKSYFCTKKQQLFYIEKHKTKKIRSTQNRTADRKEQYCQSLRQREKEIRDASYGDIR